MTSSPHPVELGPALERWLLREGDPSVQYRVLQDLLERSATDPEVVAAKQRIGQEGWAAGLLADQLEDGHWVTVSGERPASLYRPKYIATNWRLIVASDLGMTREDPRIERAARLLLQQWGDPSGAFGGTDSEVCITGNAVRMLLRFGFGDVPEVASGLDWLVQGQKPDGGWHCFPSPTGTLDCWEALAAFGALPKERWTEAIERSVRRGAEFYLERGLLTEADGSSCGPWRRYHYPHHYFYDVLLGLDLLTGLGWAADPRLAPRLDELEARRNPDGSWNLDAHHPDTEPDDEYQIEGPFYPMALEAPGRPSRWITLTALRVLHRAGRL